LDAKNQLSAFIPLITLEPVSQHTLSQEIDQFILNKLNLEYPSEQRRLKAVSHPHSSAWISAPPNKAIGTYMSDEIFITSVRRWLGDNFTLKNNIKCSACHESLTPKASHTTRCIFKGDIITRHNHIRDLFYSMVSTAALNPVKEKAGLIGETPGLRPADVFIPNLWGEQIAVDFAVTCPLQSRYKNKENPADIYALEQKHKKYDEGFSNTNINFTAAVVETFGRWSNEAIDLITEVARRGAKKLMDSQSEYINTCWARLSVSLQTDCARMLLSRIKPQNDKYYI